MFKAAFVSFGAGTSQIMVVTELIVGCAAFYLVEDCFVGKLKLAFWYVLK